MKKLMNKESKNEMKWKTAAKWRTWEFFLTYERMMKSFIKEERQKEEEIRW